VSDAAGTSPGGSHAASRAHLERLIGLLSGEQAATLSLAELEVLLEAERRELVAQLIREHNMRDGP
jgi:hypothetical protein